MSTSLGDFLRARRELVRPADVGIPEGTGVRRVPGLRREEVAMLAGISADYYLRLEQGRDRHPSPQVLEALARVLRLDDAATDHLLTLGAPAAPRRRRRPRPEVVPEGTLRLLDAIGLPAFVEGQVFDVLASNDLCRALDPSLVPGRNRLRDVFLDPAQRDLHPDWPTLLPYLVAGVRASGVAVDDPRLVELVGELSLASEEFRRLWARHDVRPRAGFRVAFAHPVVGLMELDCEKLAVGGTEGQTLAVYHAPPGTPTAERLALLGSLVARGAAGGETAAATTTRTHARPE